MSNKPEKDDAEGLTEKVTGGISVTIHELLRYSCGGMLYWLIAAVFDPKGTHEVTVALTAVPLALTALALGAVAYVVSRIVLIYPLVEWLRMEERIWFWAEPKKKWSRRHFFEVLGVNPAYSQEAWRAVRDAEKVPEKFRKQIHLQHSENHIPYITAFVCLSSIVGIGIRNMFLSDDARLPSAALIVILLICGLFAFTIGLIADARLTYQAGSFLRASGNSDKEVLREILVAAGFPWQKDKPQSGPLSSDAFAPSNPA